MTEHTFQGWHSLTGMSYLLEEHWFDLNLTLSVENDRTCRKLKQCFQLQYTGGQPSLGQNSYTDNMQEYMELFNEDATGDRSSFVCS